MKEWLTIGRITGAHGIRGEVKVMPMTDDITRFHDLETVWVRLKKKGRQSYDVAGVRFHKGQVLMMLSGVADRNAAETMKNALLEVPREEAVPLADDEIFIVDLIGLKVLDESAKEIGEIVDVLTTTGPVNTLDISLNNREKHLYVPFRRLFFPSWDLASGTIDARIPQDYFDL